MDLEKKAEAALIGQSVDYMNQSSQSATLTMKIQDPSLTNQKLNNIIVKRQGHYARDCKSQTKRVEENANLIIEEETEATLL